MSERFEVGEVAIYVKPGSVYYLNECEIVGGFEHRSGRYADGTTATVLGYQVQFSDQTAIVTPNYLRKKRPPEQTTTWDRCVWQPNNRTVTA